jgi:predicted RNA binding protein YcfA (HicA-like mRNA interferase family)
MPVSLTNDGVQFNSVPYDQYNTGATSVTQANSSIIVKARFGSGSTVNQIAPTPDGSAGIIDGTQVDMGVPQKTNNWYRLFYQTVTDDNDGNISGLGIRIERWTPSSGWNEVLSQGSHASYDGNHSDWYRQNQGIFWVPTHPSFSTQQHQFRIGFHKHDNGQIRFNASIGNDLRRNGWENNTFEVWEVDGDRIQTTGRISRF